MSINNTERTMTTLYSLHINSKVSYWTWIAKRLVPLRKYWICKFHKVLGKQSAVCSINFNCSLNKYSLSGHAMNQTCPSFRKLKLLDRSSWCIYIRFNYNPINIFYKSKYLISFENLQFVINYNPMHNT